MRSDLRAIAAETVQVLAAGGYQAPGGAAVRLAAAIGSAVAGTRLYLPGDPVPMTAAPGTIPVIEVTGETTLAAARRMGGDVAALVFASAKNPGGGFRNGARAQEEDLTRASALFACQSAVPEFYQFHRQQRDLRYSDRVIYSPAVPVFRGEDGALLDEPFPVAFVTAAAPNLGAMLSGQPGDVDGVPAVLAARARRVLEVAAAHGHRHLVLGAWGCGVFGNDPATVASAFADALDQVTFFSQVVFAVYDPRPGTPARAAFATLNRPRNGLAGP